ncbi:MAG: hypothetical protein ACSI46_11630 [Gloeotrichia echinulata DVL01]
MIWIVILSRCLEVSAKMVINSFDPSILIKSMYGKGYEEELFGLMTFFAYKQKMLRIGKIFSFFYKEKPTFPAATKNKIWRYRIHKLIRPIWKYSQN